MFRIMSQGKVGAEILSPDRERTPQHLRSIAQWVAWRAAPNSAGGKPRKLPVSPLTGREASVSDPSTWGTFDQAWTRFESDRLAGVGIVLTKSLGLVGVDLDNCIDADTGEFAEWAMEIVEELDTYTERSPSGTGLRLFVRGALPPGRRRMGDIEMYSTGRYLTVLGRPLAGFNREIEERGQEIAGLHARVFGAPAPTELRLVVPEAPAIGSLDDQELIERAMQSANSAKFRALWSGDTSGYPSQSEADLALCAIFAYWADDDTAQVDRLFRQSGLMRTKWDEMRGSTTYGARTIRMALTHQKGAHDPGAAQLDPREQPSEDCARFDLNDRGNGQRLVRRHGSSIRFITKAKIWRWWDGVRWVEDSTGQLDRYAKEVSDELKVEAAATQNEEKANAIWKWARASGNGRQREQMIKAAISEPGISIPISDLDADPYLFNVQNGTIDLRTGELRAHHREDLITKLASVDYHRNASSPRWDEFLARACDGDVELIRYIQHAFGLALLGKLVLELIFFLVGPTASGKTTLLEAIKAAFGEYAKTVRWEVFLASKNSGAITPELAQLPGVRLITASECPEGREINTEHLKALTGGDTISANPKYKDPFEFNPVFTPFLAANEAPAIPAKDDAVWRRVRVLPFENSIPEEDRDPKLKERLRSDPAIQAAILSWLVEGCVEGLRDGPKTPERVLMATGGLRSRMNPLRGFLDECCVLGGEHIVTASALQERYESWCREQGATPLEARAWGDALKDAGAIRGDRPKRIAGKVARYWSGIALLGVEGATHA